MILSTTPTIEGRNILEYKGIVTGETIIGANMFKDLFAGIREPDIATAREMFILGTTNDCLSIVRYNGTPVGDGTPGPVSKRIKALIVADIAANGTPF